MFENNASRSPALLFWLGWATTNLSKGVSFSSWVGAQVVILSSPLTPQTCKKFHLKEHDGCWLFYSLLGAHLPTFFAAAKSNSLNNIFTKTILFILSMFLANLYNANFKANFSGFYDSYTWQITIVLEYLILKVRNFRLICFVSEFCEQGDDGIREGGRYQSWKLCLMAFFPEHIQ